MLIHPRRAIRCRLIDFQTRSIARMNLVIHDSRVTSTNERQIIIWGALLFVHSVLKWQTNKWNTNDSNCEINLCHVPVVISSINKNNVNEIRDAIDAHPTVAPL
jgi:hypothetical protein